MSENEPISTPAPNTSHTADESEHVTDPSRRAWLKSAGKKAYVAPTLIAMSFADKALAQFGSAPPRP